MDIAMFASNNNLKKDTVVKWIKQDLIPRADLENDYVPDSARIPYTSARAKNAKAIYKSMVKASLQRKHILPRLYGICEDEFQGYVSRLINVGLIEPRISDEVTYYDATLEAVNASEKELQNRIKELTEMGTVVVTNIIRQFGG